MSTSASASPLSTHFATIEVHSSDAGPLESASIGLERQQSGRLDEWSARQTSTENPRRILARIPNFDATPRLDPTPTAEDSETPDSEIPDSETLDSETPDSETPDSETPDSETQPSPLPQTTDPTTTKPRFNQPAWRLSQFPPKWTLALVVLLVVVLSVVIFRKNGPASPSGVDESGPSLPGDFDSAELWNGSNHDPVVSPKQDAAQAALGVEAISNAAISNDKQNIPSARFNAPITGTPITGTPITNDARKIEQLRASVAPLSNWDRRSLPEDRSDDIASRPLPRNMRVDRDRSGSSPIPSMQRNRFVDQDENNRDLRSPPTRPQSYDERRRIRQSADDRYDSRHYDSRHDDRQHYDGQHDGDHRHDNQRYIGDRRARTSGARFDGTIQ